MLYLIGAGLSNEEFPVGAIKACKDSDVYFEKYTSYLSDDRLEGISNILGKSLKELERSDLEENVSVILKKSQKENTAIIIGGDPLTATTHKILFITAKRLGAGIKIIHASSILSALIGESGLDFYRFGSICTISRWSEHYKPVSFYESVKKNNENNLHSIILLDYKPEINSSMDLANALKIIREAEIKYKGGVFANGAKLIVMHRLGLDGTKRIITTIGNAKRIDLKQAGPTVLILPAKLSDVEKETIEAMY